ncbi:MAG: P1 family peptidase [Pseudomonadota bacterium]
MASTASSACTSSGAPRARALGIPFDGKPGPLGALTDIAGVEVGYATLVEDRADGARVRTGVTAILPRGREGFDSPVWAGMFSLNGNGELSGAHMIAETGLCELPITLTNTFACGVTRDATLQWALARRGRATLADWGLPVAAETFDGWLNDIDRFAVTAETTFAAIDAAKSGPIEEGSVGGGTGMIAYGFKGGSGTASRVVEVAGAQVTLGAFVQANFGRQEELLIGGLPVGRALPPGGGRQPDAPTAKGSSIIGVLATDAPLLPHELQRLARRAALGIARSGANAHHGSGDLFLAFTTANGDAVARRDGLARADFVPDPALDPLFRAAIEATDEAVINALVVNRDMEGRLGRRVRALPHAPLVELLRGHGRLVSLA